MNAVDGDASESERRVFALAKLSLLKDFNMHNVNKKSFQLVSADGAGSAAVSREGKKRSRGFVRFVDWPAGRLCSYAPSVVIAERLIEFSLPDINRSNFPIVLVETHATVINYFEQGQYAHSDEQAVYSPKICCGAL